jgi:hypothetical protein
MHPTYPLTPELLNSIKQYVKAQSERFQTATIDLDTVLSIGGRRLAEAVYYPLKEAVALFENEGAGKKVPGPHQGHPGFFEIHDPSYFSIDFGALSLPVRFSLDKRIETDLLTMVEVYAQIYDVENRLRFFLTDKLKEKYGEPFADKLPRKVRDSIVRHKQPAAIFVEDKRIQDLEYAEFADLKGILVANDDFLPDAQQRTALLQRLDYLAEARNYCAHNNRLVPGEVQKVREGCEVVRRVLPAT